jgi:hypothetical protein
MTTRPRRHDPSHQGTPTVAAVDIRKRFRPARDERHLRAPDFHRRSRLPAAYDSAVPCDFVSFVGTDDVAAWAAVDRVLGCVHRGDQIVRSAKVRRRAGSAGSSARRGVAPGLCGPAPRSSVVTSPRCGDRSPRRSAESLCRPCRRSPTLAPGHEDAAIERVIERQPVYLVAGKVIS